MDRGGCESGGGEVGDPLPNFEVADLREADRTEPGEQVGPEVGVVAGSARGAEGDLGGSPAADPLRVGELAADGVGPGADLAVVADPVEVVSGRSLGGKRLERSLPSAAR